MHGAAVCHGLAKVCAHFPPQPVEAAAIGGDLAYTVTAPADVLSA
ncbi:MAG TPA: hypothetical protein VJT80_24365 [Steroidobacteraceae bacterium]|nr:hypothetical protein [Steroidobacteraceae bacterium]